MNLQLLVKLYKQFLDYSNIIYSIAKIKKLGYIELDIFILSIKNLNIILKTMIFVNNINEKMVLIKYLYIKLLKNLKNQANEII